MRWAAWDDEITLTQNTLQTNKRASKQLMLILGVRDLSTSTTHNAQRTTHRNRENVYVEQKPNEFLWKTSNTFFETSA